MKKHTLAAIGLIAYIAVLIRVMVFKIVPVIHSGPVTLNFGGANSTNPPNLVPFATIIPYLLGHNGALIAMLNLVGNVALLMPVGFLVPLIYRKMNWKKALALGVASGLAIETAQTVLNVGIFDIDDVILNALGVVLGYIAVILLSKWLQEKNYKNLGIAAIAFVLAAVGAFYIADPWSRRQINERIGVGQLAAHNAEEGSAPQSGDLCGGTGGTGEIVSLGAATIDIKSKEGVVQTINLTTETDIKNAGGKILASDLKIGDHVTVVILDNNKTANTVLVCSNV